NSSAQGCNPADLSQSFSRSASWEVRFVCSVCCHRGLLDPRSLLRILDRSCLEPYRQRFRVLDLCGPSGLHPALLRKEALASRNAQSRSPAFRPGDETKGSFLCVSLRFDRCSREVFSLASGRTVQSF